MFDIDSFVEKFQRLPSELKPETLEKCPRTICKAIYKLVDSVAKEDFNNALGISVASYKTKIRKELNKYRKVISLYGNGLLGDAIDKMKEILGDSNTLRIVRYDSKKGYLYRIRSNDKYNLYSREEMFHAPINLRNNLSNLRYSISGFPCLYLGASIYVCWEETRRADIEKFNVSAFKYVKSRPLRFLLIDQPKDKNDIMDVKNLLLFLMTTLFVDKDDDKFKFQYAIPELVLHSLIQKNKKWKRLDGIAYISSRYFQSDCIYKSNHDLMMNYVIPVYNPNKEDNNWLYCPTLVKMFKVSEAKAFYSERIRGNYFKNSIIRPTGYVDSLFHQLEQEFNDKGCEYKKIENKKL